MTSFRTIVRGSLAVFGLAALAGQSANAATIVTTLFDTGVVSNNASGTPTGTIGAGATDTHYSFAAVGPSSAAPAIASGALTAATAYPTSGFPIGNPYAAPTGGSEYIGPAGAGTPAASSGGGSAPQLTNYDFRTTFSLAGFDPLSAALRGQASGDNRILAVFLNGNALVSGPNGITTPASADFQFAQFQFLAGSNFLAGNNTLDFIVANTANGTDNIPTNNLLALDVDNIVLSANALPTATPEPGSVALLIGMGVTGAGFLSRRKRAAK